MEQGREASEKLQQELVRVWTEFFTEGGGVNKGSLIKLLEKLGRWPDVLDLREHPSNRDIAVVKVKLIGSPVEVYGLPLRHNYRNVIDFYFAGAEGVVGRITAMTKPARLNPDTLQLLDVQQPGLVNVTV